MKIIIVGATGTIGKYVTAALQKDHEIIQVGSKSGDIQLDITSPDAIKQFFEKIGSFDALISTAGDGHFGPLGSMTDTDFRKGINSKLMGQVNLVLQGQHYINPKGSFTLTSGILSEDPVVYAAGLSAVNAALDGFVRGAAIELDNGVRINAVSPGVVEDSPGYFPYFPGHIPVKMDRVTQAYLKSVLGAATGQVFKVF
ncbi:NAD(P)-dependent dehydrogenase (short-subunit alcohol dehydrogenase family) [Mucilaginibacter yixingensis]|uniref:NAD(P)-dependent dehydrogenase (Short-subunit alcohol dehydrogenase family) n=1 Tax=Mucilaginibacter yixingensis TaxID=1295612 RepID=A0A2T5J880_9SPHI|nr:short chain dehydrogenase [Mucilaginibacter yixingensis]PTQ95599.1 NAD(P)-dependent dehydrogenase (short-subunit alcohol dehydrogenase family) [Mucilaginibacter yixingensis]